MGKQEKKQYNADKFEGIFNKNNKTVSDQVYNEAVYLALKAKYGGRMGLLCSKPKKITDHDVNEMREALAPLLLILQDAVIASFGLVLNDVYKDPECRDYMRLRSAGALGRTGGRPKDSKAPYLEWLERAMRTNEHTFYDSIPPFSAKDHLRELLLRHEIDFENEDGSLTFTEAKLEEMKYLNENKKPTITLSAVTKTLTRIRKKT